MQDQHKLMGTCVSCHARDIKSCDTSKKLANKMMETALQVHKADTKDEVSQC